MIIIEIEQNTDAWLELRKNHIGASDCGILMGVSKWKVPDGRVKTPRILWEEKLGLFVDKTDNWATRHGKMMEDPMRKEYEKMIGQEAPARTIKKSPDSYLIASLDGLTNDRKRAVEIKNTNREYHEMAKNGVVPPVYYPQLQQQLDVSGLDSIDYLSCHKGDMILIQVKPDKEYLKKLDKARSDFWNCVLNLKDPELTEDDYKKRDNIWIDKANELFDIQEQLKILKKQEQDIKEELKQKSEGVNSIGGDYRFACYIRKGNVNYKSVPELIDVDLEMYRSKPSEVWRLNKVK
jgi:putative phage-type endonuclease